METTPIAANADRHFIECCRTKLMKEYLPKLRAAVAGLSDEDIWWRTHETNNSIGNLMLHLAGNATQWIISSLGEQSYSRDRDREFAEREEIPVSELLERLESALKGADAVLATFPVDRLSQTYSVQTYEVTAMDAMLHVVEHFSYHLGQIVYIAKLRSGKDLKFYNL